MLLKQIKVLKEKQLHKKETFLSACAGPQFLREEKMEIGTFKPKKFVQEAFSPLKLSDPLYFMDNLKKAYVPLTKELCGEIILGEIKL